MAVPVKKQLAVDILEDLEDVFEDDLFEDEEDDFFGDDEEEDDEEYYE